VSEVVDAEWIARAHRPWARRLRDAPLTSLRCPRNPRRHRPRQGNATWVKVDTQAGRHRARAQALMRQGFDLRLLRHADHVLLPILLGGVDRVPCPHLRAGCWHSQIGVMNVGKSSCWGNPFDESGYQEGSGVGLVQQAREFSDDAGIVSVKHRPMTATASRRHPAEPPSAETSGAGPGASRRHRESVSVTNHTSLAPIPDVLAA
jgi:hypothetical protein